MLEYSNPHTGGPVMPTISCRISRLRPGFNGAAHRHTAGTVLEWGEKDVFAVPGWLPIGTGTSRSPRTRS
ncbi:hypothetical protein ABZT34_40730 [Streptomyces sp. NPDC005329]|uniref:hypothetical protein n=1 Tax=Streptomyces sp. NPDC005329 TaxID=3157034 RepID=UPI0033A97FF3